MPVNLFRDIHFNIPLVSTMIKTYFKHVYEPVFHEVNSFKEGSWIHISETKDEDIQDIISLTGLEKADLQDALDLFEIPRVEKHENAVIIFLRTPSSKTKGLHTEPLTIVMTHHNFITITPRESFAVNSILNASSNMATTNFTRLLVEILKKISFDYTRMIKNSRNIVLRQKKDVHYIDDEDILVLIENEEILNQYQSVLVPMKMVVENIESGRFVVLSEDDHEVFQDMINTIRQLSDVCMVNLKSIRSLRDSYQIIFTNRLNRTIKFLTSFTIIMTIPTIVASIFGMNVELPFSNNPHAFFITMSIAFGILIVFLVLFYKKRWI